MRARLLERGGAALADYELLEMLLFLGIERRDTKPLAKAAVNEFGSFAAVVLAPDQARGSLPGMTAAVAGVMALVRAAAAQLAAADARARPVLGSYAALRDYFMRVPSRPGRRALFLDTRNKLIADEMPEAGAAPVLQRALALHATALVLVGGEASTAALAAFRREAAKVALPVHDWFLEAEGEWLSLASGRVL